MQRQLFNYMFGRCLSCFGYTGPLRGGHDAEVAHGENEFDAPVVDEEVVLTVERDAVVVLNGFKCCRLRFEVDVRGSFAAAGPVVVHRRFL